jgi:HlyD family secretion protein
MADAPTQTTIKPPEKAPEAAQKSLGARMIDEFWTHKWSVLIAVIVLGLGVWQGIGLLLGPSIAVDLVKRGTIIESVVATGSVQTPFRVEIGSQITGTVDDVLVIEGQRVSQGQPLISLVASEYVSDQLQAQGALAQAQAHMRQIEELTLPTARQSLKEAIAGQLNFQQTFDRVSALARDGFATRAALDAAQKDLNVAHTQVQSAQLMVTTSAPGGSDYVTAQTQMSQAQAALNTATSRLGYTTIAAPRAGVLITRNVERGTVVQPGKMLVVLAPDGETQLLLAIDERNLGKLELGQTALVSADAYPEQKFDAVVAYINPGIDITRASVEVKLNVKTPPAYLRQDMTVSVDIQVGRSDNALLLPVRSIHDALTLAPWVTGIRNGRTYKQPVRLGLQGNTQIEIKEGLDEGAAAVPSTVKTQLGDQIRPISP